MKFVLFILFLLTLSACNSGGGGGSSSGGGSNGPKFIVTGNVTYDYVPINASGLSYASTQKKPIRNAVIKAVNNSNGKTLASTTTDDNGNYHLSVPENSVIRIEIIAKMKSPSVVIEDNTDNNAEYVASSNAYTISSDNYVIPNLNAPSGWSTGSNSYTSTRVAAPFAILDSIYSAVKKVRQARPNITFPALKVNWSVNNAPTSGDTDDGHIGTSHYDGDELYILGKANIDSDEYDRHVIVHEWGHFFEDKLGRSDSIGGPHSGGDILDRTVAFGEGWGNALSGMVFDPEYTYLDSYGNLQGNSFGFNLENSGQDSTPGWFSEISVQEILFDIYDSYADAGDNLNMGIGPIIDVLMTSQKTTPAVTSIHSFIAGLKSSFFANAGAINTLVATKNMTVADAFGTTETNDGGIAGLLPLYKSVTVDGATEAIELAGGTHEYNGAPNNKYFRFKATSKNSMVSWTANDTFALTVFENGTERYYKEEIKPTTSVSSYSKSISTTVGKDYLIHIFTVPDYMADPSQPMNITLKVE